MEKARAVILAFTPEPERMCASAARISSTKGAATEIYENTDRTNIGPLIKRVVALGHVTITEHAVFNIAFENVSAFFEQFLIEFRLAAYTIKSRRYVDYSEMGGLAPEFRLKKGGVADASFADRFEALSSELFEDYHKLLEAGVPKEDARFVLPYCLRSHIYCTVNARELLHILHSCLHGRGAAYPEIRQIGESLLAQAKEILPDVFDDIDKVEKGREDKEVRLRELLAGKGVQRRAEGDSALVELLTHSGEPDLMVAVSALVSHSGCSSADALTLLKDDESLTAGVIDIVTSDRRRRELEQVNVTFRLNDMSLSCLTHLARHRIQSLVVPSFTEFGKSRTCVMPETITENEAAKEIYMGCFEKSMDLYESFLDAGVMEEDLVYLYLSGNVMDVVTTMNGRELYHFLKLRCCDRAQWEIRNYAVGMLSAVRGISPVLFGKVGPGCFMDGVCPEGKMSCGKQVEMKQLFSNMQ
ncbi:FAD-dependent thymidylate synthase [Desulfoluna spongiiphila]|uniref:FAD-dependent thymidylate synthase n=1 Tax=Desulfoluna spongiiphila TaxID=419481 RepID=A0A1G5DBD9_9BACT|nr:FAD-dependent thymidylate synthase [Desulfoluna spongiiphila]SCY11841.1 thymidylate synthase (FAD) [Desulfoluna spongiiphila]VVS95237.1 thymidylate synthase thyx [Desulfoluna spongiiphila]